MSSIARGPHGALSLESYTKKIQSVLDMHRVEFGAPENLSPFLKRVREDRHLAMDFWALTAAISTGEGGDLPHDQMLEIIVRGVTGKEPAEIREPGDDEMKQTLDDLGRLLAGVDLDSPPMEAEDTWPVVEEATWSSGRKKSLSQQPVSMFSRIKSVPPIEKPTEPIFDEPVAKDHEINTAPAVEQEYRGAPSSQPSQPVGGPSSASPALSKEELDDALSRLEMSSRDLRLHLENIDSRMSRIEPHLEELSYKATSSPGNTSQQVNGARSDDRMDARVLDSSANETARSRRHNPDLNPRLVLLTDREDDDDDPSIHVPLSDYASARGPRTLRLFLAFLLVLGGLFVVQQKYGAQLWEQNGPRLQQLFHQTYDELAKKLHSRIGSKDQEEPAAVASGDDHSADPMSSTTSPSEESLHAAPTSNATPAAATPDEGDSETATGSPSAPPPAPVSASGTPPPPAPSPAPAAPPAPVAAPPAPATTVSPREALVTHSRLEPRTVRGSGRAGHEPADGGDFTRAAGRYSPAEIPVNVPPAVMQENLITSRVPAYPQAARADGVEGWVVMQAIISKNGTVDQLHVIQGDPLLRSAASEAVSRWHYRPYTVNGRPVDVATIVKVEFKLPRRY